MKKLYIHIILYMALVSLASACVYPFEAKVANVDGTLVIEGDVIVGGETNVSLGYLYPLGIPEASMQTDTPSGKVWVEDSEGGRYDAVRKAVVKGCATFTVDTRLASPDCQYRLCVTDLGTGRNYVSAWLDVNPAPQVDSIGYEIDYQNVNLTLSAHSDDDSDCFRWTYVETWKFHADYAPSYFFDENTGTEVKYEHANYDNYWCWHSESSTEVDLCATSDLKANYIVNRKFKEIKRTDKRFQRRYKIVVDVRTISKDAYRYLSNLKLTSNFTGDLFTPNPSDVRGNITCVENPDEYVIGYIDAGRPSRIIRYLNGSDNNIYIHPGATTSPFIPDTTELTLWYYYNMGFVPIMDGITSDGESGILWDYARCIDCRKMGGTTVEPEDWEDR